MIPPEYVPVAVNCWVAPAVIEGFTGVTAMDKRVAVTVMLNALVVVWAGPAESVTRAVKLNVPVDVGVPLMAPLEALSVRPLGKAPAASDQVYGGVPPETKRLAE